MLIQMPSQPIKVYSSVLSGHSHRVRLLLSLLELPHEVVEVDVENRANRRPEFLAKNPLGEIPVIEDGELIVYDSNAILVYLSTRYDNGTWLPRDPLSAARIQRWLGLAAGPIAYGPNRARLATLFKVPVDHLQAKDVSFQLLGNLERELKDREFALGEKPSIADVAAYAYVALAPEGGVSLEAYPNVRGWLTRVEGLPRFTPMQRSGPLPCQ